MNARGLVVDASIAMKWVIDEELSEQARALLRDQAVYPIVAPLHFLSEVTNALHQRVRRGHMTDDEAQDALAEIVRLGVTLQDSPGLYGQALTFARSNRLPATYDSLYVVLAQILGIELWTADERLLNAIRAKAPWVRWIGDYQP